MTQYKKIAFIFPGQGSQYPGMGKDFVETYSTARLTFEEGDEVLKRKLSEIVLKGSDTTLTETKNSQPGIYLFSMAIWRVIREIFPQQPYVCAGLSLGEYTALTASESLSFIDCLPLIQKRAQFMNEACEVHKGTMAAIIGLEGNAVDQIVKEVNLPKDLWVANYNCPGQVVLSGTIQGIERGIQAARLHGAKKVLPLQVSGAFHSGLMHKAEERLTEYIHQAPLKRGLSLMVMNVPGDFVSDIATMRHCLIKQVTSSVRWEQGVCAMDKAGVDLFVEIGPGKTLAGMNKRIGVKAPTYSVETVKDLEKLMEEVG